MTTPLIPDAAGATEALSVVPELTGPWHCAPFGSRFPPVAAISLENVNVVWSADISGSMIDPTSLPVQFAFPASSGLALAPAEPATWYAGAWLPGVQIRGFVAQCLIGPAGLVTLTPGQKYDVWCKITGNPQSPAVFAGTLSVY